MKDRKDASHRLATSRSPGFCMNSKSIHLHSDGTSQVLTRTFQTRFIIYDLVTSYICKMDIEQRRC